MPQTYGARHQGALGSNNPVDWAIAKQTVGRDEKVDLAAAAEENRKRVMALSTQAATSMPGDCSDEPLPLVPRAGAWKDLVV